MNPASSDLLETNPLAPYWEERALRFAGRGSGLRAVCSYGMPGFYNRSIDLCQRLALRTFLRVAPGTRVLDVGCGIGRWSRMLAERHARVVGIDLSSCMIAEAERRAKRQRLSGYRFRVADVAAFELNRQFDLVMAVTVLQHVLDPDRLETAADSMVRHLDPDGRLLLLEAAPTLPTDSCDSAVFHARTKEFYVRLFEARGLRLETCRGVDPMPLKTRFLPYYSRLPRLVANSLLAGVTAVSLPVDACLGRLAADRSWHKVLVFRREGRG